MTLYKNKYRVETTRLKGWDYASPGWYFVTLCTQDRVCSLGQVVEGQVRLTPTGLIVQRCLLRIPQTAPHVRLDALVVMPNHVHAIIVLEDQVAGQPSAQHDDHEGTSARGGVPDAARMSAISPRPGSLPAIIRSCKAAASRRCAHRGLGGPIWQERYYEHIIRDDGELERIRAYIANNPLQWQEDRLYAGHGW